MDMFNNDKPVSARQDDHFQRYAFAKRIASLVNSGHFSTSQVIGIYGKWGEGKSSVLNFIRTELDSDVIAINFNPWYFQDEKSLVKSFFENIGGALGKKLTNKEQLIVEAFENYSDTLGTLANAVIPHGGGALFNLGKKIASKFKKNSLEDFKTRAEELIMEANANFVVFMDDIDRLNIEEIQAVFKLVKLAGDFPRFSYILAFDDDLIASSLGHQYGGREKKDGYEFLEKIIQLPLQLPKASSYALRKHSLALIDKALKNLQVILDQKELKEFFDKYDTAFVPALKNPRLGVRYANTIAFTIPLLLGEVHIADLMIVEGFKVFYPELYYFIRHNSGFFLSIYSSDLGIHDGTLPERKKKAVDSIDKAIAAYDEKLRPKIKDMLMELFPQIKGLYLNQQYGQAVYDKWYRQRRICSTYYFERYFSYVVKEGDISDVYFTELFSNAANLTSDSLSKKIQEELAKLEADGFIFKLRSLAENFSADEAKNIFLALAMVGPSLTGLSKDFLFTPKEEISGIIVYLICKLNRQERVLFCKEAINKANPFNYALAMHYRFTYKPSHESEETFLNAEEAKQISESLIAKFEEESKRRHVLTDYPDWDLENIFNIYLSVGKESDVRKMLEAELIHNHQFPLKLVRIFTPTIYITGKPSPFKSGFDVRHHQDMEKFIDPALVYDKLTRSFGNLNPDTGITFGDRDVLSDLQLVELFQKIHRSVLSKNNDA